VPLNILLYDIFLSISCGDLIFNIDVSYKKPSLMPLTRANCEGCGTCLFNELAYVEERSDDSPRFLGSEFKADKVNAILPRSNFNTFQF
jgi:hypothetical protein